MTIVDSESDAIRAVERVGETRPPTRPCSVRGAFTARRMAQDYVALYGKIALPGRRMTVST
jgi:hypothetical protein